MGNPDFLVRRLTMVKVHTYPLLLCFICILAGASNSSASVPLSISYQGQLLDSSANPITTSADLTFTLWDSAVNGNQIGGPENNWSDTDTLTPDANGFYSTEIGDDPDNPVPNDVWPTPELWLQISVNNTVMSPRTRLLSVPYAFHSATADSSQTAQTAQSISGSSLSSPGDSVQLADNVTLEVDDDGNIRFVINGQEYRLVEKEWSWDHPDELSDNISPDGSWADFPVVAMNSNGEAIITWNQFDGLANQIYKSEYFNGIWTHPTSLSDNISPDGSHAYYPVVAMNSNGEAIITWNQSDGANDQIFKSEYRNGTWTHPKNLSDYISPDVTGAFLPQVAMNENGDAIITWRQYDGTTFQIFKSEYHSGSWTHPANLSDNISPDGFAADLPQVALNDNGEAIITWNQSDGANDQIFKSEYRNGTWTHPKSVSENISPGGFDTFYPQVAMNINGEAIITWYQSDGLSNQIFKSEYRNGSWIHPTSLTDNISLDGSALEPQVGINDTGEVLITWYQSDGENDEIFKSEYRNGTWTHPTDLSENISPDGQDAGFPQIALSNNGSAIIVWWQYDDINRQIFMSHYKFAFP